MPKTYRPREVIRVLESLGWTIVRQRGSHVMLHKEGVRNHVAVPMSRREVNVGTFRNVLKQAGMLPEEFDEVARGVL